MTKAFSLVRNEARFHPSRGYAWKFEEEQQNKAAIEALSKQHTEEEKEGDGMVIDESISEMKIETEDLFVLKSHQQALESRMFSSTIDQLIYRSVSFKQNEEVPVIPVMVKSPEPISALRSLTIPLIREGDLVNSPLSSSSTGVKEVVKGGKRKRKSDASHQDPSEPTKRRKSSRRT